MAEGKEPMDLAARVQALEEQVERLRDELQLYRLVASYAPAVDSGSADIAADLWTVDGVYDVDVGVWTGHGEIAGMIDASTHQGLIKQGCAHVISMPHLTVADDTAVATCHSRLYVKRENGFGAWRVAANRWEFVRTPAGWRISRRINRLLDGADEARDLLKRGFDPPDASLANGEAERFRST